MRDVPFKTFSANGLLLALLAAFASVANAQEKPGNSVLLVELCIWQAHCS